MSTNHAAAIALLVMIGGACGSGGSPRLDATGDTNTNTNTTVSTTMTTNTTTNTNTTVASSVDRSSSSAHSVVKVDGGTVTVAARDGVIEVLEVDAEPGWEATWDDGSTDVITVSFLRGSDIAEVELRLTAGGGIRHSTSVRTGGAP